MKRVEHAIVIRRPLDEVFAYVYEPCRSFGLRIVSGPAPGTVLTTFSSVEGGTRLHLVAEVTPRGALRFVGAALGQAARQELVASCERLKLILEGSVTLSGRSKAIREER